ncbi:Imm49 family immunity protein [Cystobacter ferrugineus]|uniref:Uncharacterized protein n=1 Tax=Cystobacter ferrugineus TaxID=83449 RepID=A0A1L9B5R1_9BACT|nr:Imm49 family immunity protein [Cystobacter ferrugineus]OJH37563.1 hypothetical protein BON30_25505 [Cystobacter ferrugineus]
MNKARQLKISLRGLEVLIKRYMNQEVTRPYEACRGFGNLVDDLVDAFHNRALLRFLLNADVDGFFEDLNRSALTYLTLLKGYHQHCDVEKTRANAYTALPLACVLAADNIPLAREIDSLMPRELEVPERRNMFVYTRVLRALATGDEQTLAMVFQEAPAACTGWFRLEEKVAVLDGLVRRDEAAFNQSLLAYLNSFEELDEDEREELSPGADDLDVEALAFVQLARKRGLALTTGHRMLPPELIEPRSRIPRDGYPAWP